MNRRKKIHNIELNATPIIHPLASHCGNVNAASKRSDIDPAEIAGSMSQV